MPSTYTLNNGIELIATGEQSGTWGATTNVNLALVDTALDGQVTVTLPAAGSSGAPNALPISDGSASDGRNRLVIFADGGDLGATAFVQLTPNDAEKIVYIRNNLSGSRSITLFQGTYNASNDYEVPAGTTAIVFFNGAGAGAVAANVFNNALFDAFNVVGNGAIGGNLTVTGTVDAGTVEFNNLSGTGSVSVTNILDEDNMASNSATALATQQSIKAYVDSQVTAQDLDFAGDSGTGAVDLDSQTFTVSGTTNQITTAASGQTVTVSLPATIATTTADLTNLEVTNIKAKDGTASATIANSTGVLTVASSVLTTTDINGGTIDGATIGGASAAAGTFTNLEANGTIKLDGNYPVGTLNVALGAFSLIGNTTGCNNTASGSSALRCNTTGTNNTASGSSALFSNTTGCNNTASGLNALCSNTTGTLNTASGSSALRCNTTGSLNTASGFSALFSNTTGCNNTASGFSALFSNTTGCNNTASGLNALRSNTTGGNNIGIGVNAGRTGATPAGICNITTESDYIVMGNDAHTCALIKVAWTATSDCRDKTCFKPLDHGLDFVRALKPTEYQFKKGGRDSVETDGKRRYGFLAQDILPLEGDAPVIISADNPEKLQYTESHLIPILVKAVQELTAEVDRLRAEMEELKNA